MESKRSDSMYSFVTIIILVAVGVFFYSTPPRGAHLKAAIAAHRDVPVSTHGTDASKNVSQSLPEQRRLAEEYSSDLAQKPRREQSSPRSVESPVLQQQYQTEEASPVNREPVPPSVREDPPGKESQRETQEPKPRRITKPILVAQADPPEAGPPAHREQKKAAKPKKKEIKRVSEKAKPLVMVIVMEQFSQLDSRGRIRMGNKQAEWGEVQSIIENALKKAGYPLVSRQQMLDIKKRDWERYLLNDDMDGLIANAQRYGAEIIVSGMANVAPNKPINFNGVTMYSANATVQVKAVIAEKGTILSSVVKKGKGRALTPRDATEKALKDAAKQAAKSLVRDLIGFLNGGPESPAPEVEVVVENVNYPQLKKVVVFLDDLKEVDIVHILDFTAKIATLRVKTSLNGQQMADNFTSFEDDDFELEVSSVSRTRIRVRVTED